MHFAFCILLFFSCGTPKSVAELGEVVYQPRYAEGFTLYENGIDINGSATLFSTPPQRVVCMSSTYIAYIDALGLTERIVGVSGAMYITNPTARKATDIGYDTNIDYEKLVALEPDLVFIYGIGGANTTMEQKFTELGIDYIYIPDFVENSPLGKAEWIVAIGAIMGVRQEAETIFEGIAERYETLKAEVANIAERASVMLNAPYRDVWYIPSDKSYIVQLIEDAGGEYACKGYTDGRESLPISGEAAYVALSQADYWLNPNQYRTLAELTAANPKFADVPSVENRLVYNCTLRTTAAGGSDFWESGALRADVVLRDLIVILHPEMVDNNTETYYFERLN